MSEAGLKFVNIQECEIFLVRYFSREFEDRAFFLPSQIDTLNAIEKSSKANSSWRLCSDHCACAITNFSDDSQVNMLISKLNKVDIECGGCESVSKLHERFGLMPKFTNDDESDQINTKMRLSIDLLLCLLSPALDYRDIWSVTRFFSRVCANVLPALRKRAEQTDGDLNIMSVLLSYIMTSELDGTKGNDPTLSANFTVLKNFTDTITKMTDLLQDDLPEAVAMRELIKTAVAYLRSLKCFTSLNELSNVQKFVGKQLAEVEANFNAITASARNDYQKLSIYTKRHVLAFALRDRLVCLDCITDIGAASPLFKSPYIALPAVSTQSPVEEKVARKEEDRTPSSSSSYERPRFVQFINFDTPELNTEQIVTAISSVDSGIIEDAYGDDKENLDPDAIVVVEEFKKKDETPIRPKTRNAQRLCMRDTNRKYVKSNIFEENGERFDKNDNRTQRNKRISGESQENYGSSTSTKNYQSRKMKTNAKMPKLRDGQTKLTNFFTKL